MSFLHKVFLVIALFLSAVTMAAAGPIDINSADAETLATTIKGIGAKKAEAIVAYRVQHGPFKSIDELAQVKGIGEKTVEMNRGNLTVGKPVKQAAKTPGSK